MDTHQITINALSIVERQKIEFYLKKTGSKIPDWENLTNDDYTNVSFAYTIISRFNDNPITALEAHEKAITKSDKAMSTYIENRKREKSKSGSPKLTIEDFDGDWSSLKHFLGNCIKEGSNIWRKTFKTQFLN